MDKVNKELLNKTEAAEVLGITRQTLRKWQLKGYGPRFRGTPFGRDYTTRTNCREFLAHFSNESDSDFG